ncbi:hypothetical protein PEC302110_35470 [Pectobacterium araliae]|uniref:Uncharacterized protein n=1 Tax=Pectobacterium araliae TaxID=3073862 RepID=A0AAN0KD61_9GAMM|nr:hypothetical protein PEC302110_35470 [Pectobacterium sp. MAFF 302110]
MRRAVAEEAGSSTEQTLKLRIMSDYIVITTQDIRELWGNRQALGLAPFDEYMVTHWLNHFPGGLDLVGNN